MLRVDEVSITNFRSCKKTRLSLSDFTPLVGRNNAGKSNIMSAISWFLAPTSLKSDDFGDTDCPVSVEGQISGLTGEILDQLAENHRKDIEAYCMGGILRIRRTQSTPNLSASKVTLEVRDVGIADETDEAAWKPNPTGISNAIKAMFPTPIVIGAMEDAAEDVGKNKTTTTIGKLIALLIKPIEKEHSDSLMAALEPIAQRLSAEGKDRSEELTAFDTGANASLESFFPGIRIRAHIPPPEIKELFKAGTIRVFEDGDYSMAQSEGRDISSLGHGAQRSIQMALIKYLADRRSAVDGDTSRTFLLIDEPELYLHPQGVESVRAALHRLSKGGYQVVFSTHSPLMITTEDILNANIVRKADQDGTTILPRMAETISGTESQMNMLFDMTNSCKILFSDQVLLVEGRTEDALLCDLHRAVTGKTLASAQTGIVKVNGSGSVLKSMAILNGMKVKTKAIVDLDFAFGQAIKSGLLQGDDTDIVSARKVFSTLVTEHQIDLTEEGFPKNARNGMTAAEAFAVFAKDPHGFQIAQRLHRRMKDHGIWLWPNGAIEDHLGIQSKNEGNWAAFRWRLRNEAPDKVIADFGGVRDLADWLSPDTGTQPAGPT